MKRKLILFLVIAGLSFLAIPLTNLFFSSQIDRNAFKQGALFNADGVSSLFAKVIYPLGISQDSRVLIGHNNWLYLDSEYREKRAQVSDTGSSQNLALRIGAALEQWNAFFLAHHIPVFEILIAPNKASIYPEFLPAWASPRTSLFKQGLIPEPARTLYFDPSQYLIQEKPKHSSPLYYQTDTHWNALGAGLAFQAFANQVGKRAPEIRWPSAQTVDLLNNPSRPGGDLANLLRLSNTLSDHSPTLRGPSTPVGTVRLDYDTQTIRYQGGNPPFASTDKPTLIQSTGALNHKKVLWLSDSFGTELTPMMTMTFDQILFMHWDEGIRPGGRLAELVTKWKPDYVFFTVAERSLGNGLFAAYPPPTFTPKPNQKTKNLLVLPAEQNDLQVNEDQRYSISGNDPFLIYTLKTPIDSKNLRFLKFNVQCNSPTTSMLIKLFWLEEGELRFLESSSSPVLQWNIKEWLDLSSLAGWQFAKPIQKLRIDFENPQTCTQFIQPSLELGTLIPTSIKH
jgi:alginate O-acetyltransferase complex protein AlgJ